MKVKLGSGNESIRELQNFFIKNNLQLYLNVLIGVLLTWGIYFIYIFPKMLYRTEEGITAGWVNIWGDWPTHFAFASRFAYTPPDVWFTSHPFYFNQGFRHHFLANLISGILIRIGFDEISAFIVPSIITAIILLIVLYVFYSYAIKSPGLSFLALTLFLASGGVGFWWFIKDFIKEPRLETLLFPPNQYTSIPSEGISCINVITSELLPQRSFLLGLPIALAIILFLYWITQNKDNKVTIPTFVTLGILIGLLPIVHVFSYLVVLLFVFIFFAFARSQWIKWLVLLLTVFLSAFIVKAIFSSISVPKEFIKLYPGWLSNPDEYNLDFVYFWWINWGLFFPLTVIAIIEKKFYRNPLILGGILIFVLGNMFLFSRWSWNNYKFITWSHLIFCIPVTLYLGELWRGKRFLMKAFVIVAVVLMTLSGFIDLFRLTRTSKLSHLIWDNSELEIAKKFREITKPNARVLTADTHDHWVLSLTGRQVLMGMKGKLWSWGIDCGETPEHIKVMFSGGANAKELLKKYKVDYVVIGPQEIERYNADKEFFSQSFKDVLVVGKYNVYSVSG